jgi:hypothetical protein
MAFPDVLPDRFFQLLIAVSPDGPVAIESSANVLKTESAGSPYDNI